MIFEDLRRILSVKAKQRCDSYFDQYTRLLVPKLLFVSSIIISINWFQDEVHCIVPTNVDLSADFVSDTCWINGLYIYQNMTNRSSQEAGYYGIPLDLSFDGLYHDGRPCSVLTRHGRLKPNCIPMEKAYYLQYQWFPFFIASLMILYFLPYTLFVIVNIDMEHLRNSFQQLSPEDIVESYFPSFNGKPLYIAYGRTIGNCAVKLLYIFTHFISFSLIDKSLNGKFQSFGMDWLYWKMDEGKRIVKPGEVLLPIFGLCDVIEGGLDKRWTTVNIYRLICEYSPHVLYHYVLLILWFLIVIGFALSSVSLLHYLWKPFSHWVKKSNGSYIDRDVLQILTVREADYLDLIKDNDCTLYNEVLMVLCSDKTRALHGKVTYKTLYEDIQSIAMKLEELERKEIKCRSNDLLLPFD